MRVMWDIDDGYVGSRPHYITIDDEELEEMTDEEQEAYIEECVKDAFEQTITYHWRIV